MIRKISALLTALVFALTAFAPSLADARDRRGHGYWDRGYHRDYDRRHWRHRDHDRGDAVAAGAVGLIVGLALGSLASQSSQRDCYDGYRRCAPPPPRRDCYDPCRYEGRYADPYYDGSAYEGDYYQGYDPYVEDRREQCTRRERQWDRYANRYVWVDVPC